MNTSIISRLKDGVINLGIANGWSVSMREECTQLRKLMIEGSQHSRELGRCYNEYSFDAIVEGQICKVVYTVDSGD